MRDILLERLKQDLMGPYTEDEVLAARPSDVYLTGILWPRETRMGAEEDERLGLSGVEESETDGGGEEEEVSLAGLIRPCSAGVSFAARSAEGCPELDVRVRFATYEPVTAAAESGSGRRTGKRKTAAAAREDGRNGNATRMTSRWTASRSKMDLHSSIWNRSERLPA